MKIVTRPALCGVIGLSAMIALPAAAQEDLEDVRLSFGIEQRIETGRNLRLRTPAEGSGTIATTRLSFGLNSESRIQSLLLDSNVILRLSDLPGDGSDVDFGDGALALEYRREVANAELTFSGNYERQDLDFEQALSEFIGENGTIELPNDFGDLNGGGRRSAYDLTLGLELGRQDLIGYVFSLGIRGINYFDTTDPDLTSSDTVSGSAGLILRFSPITTGRADLAIEKTDENNSEQTETTTTTATFGLEHEFTPRLRMTAGLGYRIKDTAERIVGASSRSTSENGAFGALGVVYDMTNGSISADVATMFDDAGRLSTFLVGRTLDLQRNGTLTGSLGVADPEGGDVELIGSVGYRQEFGPSDVLLNASRSIGTSTDDESQINHTLALGTIYNIDPLAQLGFSVAYVRTGETLTNEQLERTDINATYTRALAPDWDLSVGATHRIRDEGDVGRNTSSSVFLSLERRFEQRR